MDSVDRAIAAAHTLALEAFEKKGEKINDDVSLDLKKAVKEAMMNVTGTTLLFDATLHISTLEMTITYVDRASVHIDLKNLPK